MVENQTLPTCLSSPLYCRDEKLKSHSTEAPWPGDPGRFGQHFEILKTEEKSQLSPQRHLQTRMWVSADDRHGKDFTLGFHASTWEPSASPCEAMVMASCEPVLPGSCVEILLAFTPLASQLKAPVMPISVLLIQPLPTSDTWGVFCFY